MPIAASVVLGERVAIFHPDLVNLYGCRIGDDTKIGSFVEIQKNAEVGSRCKISSHTFICEGVTIEDEVFIGHGVMFINDSHPRATSDGQLQTEADWVVVPTRVRQGASIGSGATILCGLTIGEKAMVGAGAVVTRDVAAGETVVGVPARVVLRSLGQERRAWSASVSSGTGTGARISSGTSPTVPRPGLLRCAIYDRSDLRRRSDATPVSSRHPTRRG